MAHAMRCNVCKDAVTVPYFNIPTHHTDTICGCCAMDSTIMGKYAPYTLNNHKKAELFLGYWVNCIFNNFKQLNIDVSMDKSVCKVNGKEYKPDMFMVMTNPDSNSICAINLEIDNLKQKQPEDILQKEMTVRNYFLGKYLDKKHVCILSLNAMMHSSANVGGTFEIFYALNYVLDAMFLECDRILHLPAGDERMTYSGLALLNYSIGVESIYNYKIAMNPYMLPALQHLLLNPDVRDDEWFDQVHNTLTVFPPAIKATDSCVYAKFRKVAEFIESHQAQLGRYLLLSMGTGNLLLVKLVRDTMNEVKNMADNVSVEVMEFDNEQITYPVRKNRVVQGRKLLNRFRNVLHNRAYLLKKLDELEDHEHGAVQSSRRSIQSLSSMEISLVDNMKLVELTNY